MPDDDKEFAAEVTEEVLEQLLVKKGEDIDYRGSSHQPATETAYRRSASVYSGSVSW